ncbi:hypothetical protein D3C85_691990 [compost metagenome]
MVVTILRLRYRWKLINVVGLDRIAHASAAEEKKHKLREKVVIFRRHIRTVKDAVVSQLNRSAPKLKTTHTRQYTFSKNKVPIDIFNLSV